MTSFALTASAARTYLETHLSTRQVNKVLHSFPSPRFWKDQRHTPLDARPAGSGAPTSELYVALPFCLVTQPAHCGYCLFPTEGYESQDQLDVYLNALEQEGELYRERWQSLAPRSIFIGGGTPNLLKVHQYPRLLGMIRRLLPSLESGTPVTLEGIPQLFNRDKLEAMQTHGVTRISMGAQQLDPELSRLSGRSQQPRHVFQAVEWASELGLGCNVDLIYGWPQQTLTHMRDDLKALMGSGVQHITHYELNVGGATDFALNHRQDLPSPERVREMYHEAVALLTSGGYVQLTPYDFQKMDVAAHSDFVYEECRRSFDPHDVWAWGYAAISDLPGHRPGPQGDSGHQEAGGWTFMNHRTLTGYYASIDQGRLPVECSYSRTPADLRLSLLFRTLQALRIDRASYRHNFGLDVVDEFRLIWEAAGELGLLTVDEEAITLTEEGAYRVPLLQTTLMQSRVEELTEEHFARLRLAVNLEARP